MTFEQTAGSKRAAWRLNPTVSHCCVMRDTEVFLGIAEPW